MEDGSPDYQIRRKLAAGAKPEEELQPAEMTLVEIGEFSEQENDAGAT